LLDTGQVDIDSKDKNGRSPLSWAAQFRSKAVVKLLLEMGEEVHADSKDNDSRTPLWYATKHCNPVERDSIVSLLLATGNVDPSATDKYGVSPLGKIPSITVPGV